jgi:hypothetical protein
VAPAAFDVLELDQGVEFAKKRGAWHAGGAGETAQRHRLAVRAPDEDARVPNLFGGLGTFGPFGISPLCTLSISRKIASKCGLTASPRGQFLTAVIQLLLS